MANNNFRNNNFFSSSRNPFDIDTVRNEKAELSLLAQAQIAEREAYLGKTLLKDSVSPITGKAFGELYALSTSKSNYEAVILFPWLSDKGAVQGKQPWAAANAIVDGFGTQKYSVLRVDEHIKLFDPATVWVGNAKALQLWDGTQSTWKPFTWRDWGWERGSFKNDKHAARWTAKHVDLNLMLRALETGVQYHITFFQDGMAQKWVRNIEERLDWTLRKVLEQNAEDGAVSQAVRELKDKDPNARPSFTPATPKAPEGAVVVGGVDLSKITSPVTLVVDMKGLVPFEHTVNPADPRSLLMVSKNLGKPDFKFSLK